MDVLKVPKWETHLSKASLLGVTYELNFKESLKFMRALPKTIHVNNEMYREYRRLGVSDWFMGNSVNSKAENRKNNS